MFNIASRLGHSPGRYFIPLRKGAFLMTTSLTSRRDFSLRLASLFPALGITAASSGAFAAAAAPDDTAQGVSRAAEAIHQEPAFKASRARIYEALLDEKQFTKFTDNLPAKIDRVPGGAFSLFGGLVRGRNIDLSPNQFIVQAWRSESWSAGVYSLVRFALTEQGSGTKIVFDHTGFPAGQADHLAEGWRIRYWQPLEKYLV
jgi:activator of HSP90 ATPase